MILDASDLSPRPVDDFFAVAGGPQTFPLLCKFHALILNGHSPQVESLTTHPAPHCDQLGQPFASLPMCQ